MAAGWPHSKEGRLNRQREPLPTRVHDLPALSAAYEAALQPAVAALDLLGVRLDAAARTRLADHLRLLVAWNEAINLTAIVDPAAMARLHVADSLAAVPVIRDGPHSTLLDLGSGAGFPGLPLAITLPTTRATLVESVGKKARFLDAAVASVDLAERVHVLNARAEALAPGSWDVVTARAVGSLADLIEIALPLLAAGGRLVAWKRGEFSAELEAAGRAAAALGASTPAWHAYDDRLASAAGLAGHGLVVVRKSGPTPPGFPRDPAARNREPW